MGYTEEEKRIFDYVTENGMIIELTANMDNVKRYYRELKTYADSKRLAIRYPGYKTTKTKCDYCVCIVDERGENPISHVEIMYDLYNKTFLECCYWTLETHPEASWTYTDSINFRS